MKLKSGETASSRRAGGVRRFLPVFLCVFLFLSAVSMAFAQSAREYPDKRSGDEACRAEDFAVAVSFYRKYREEAESAGDRAALQDAYEREIDALIRGGLAQEAENALNAYERSFVGLNSLSVSLWRANIMILRRQVASARTLLSRILAGLPAKDPRRMQALASMAFVEELDGHYAASARLYLELAKLEGESSLVLRSLERGILMLTAAGRVDDALAKLKAMPLANRSRRELRAARLLGFYLRLKKEGPAQLGDDWSEVAGDPPENREMFFHTAFLLISDEFKRAGDIAHALEACGLAFSCAPSRTEAAGTLARMIDMLEAAGKKKSAADLTLAWYDLFRGADASPAVKLRAGVLLAAGGRGDKALIVFKSIFENPGLSPDDRDSAFRVAFDTLLKQKMYAEADALAHFRYRAEPENPELLFFRAEVLLREGKTKEAADLYQTIGDGGGPRAHEAYTRAVQAYSGLRMYDDVIRLCNLILKKDPSDPVIFYRADAYEGRKDPKNALADYQACGALPAEVMPSEWKARALYRSGCLLLEEGKTAEAVKAFQTVFRKFGDSPYAAPAGSRLVHAYSALGDDVNAEKTTWLLAERFPESEYTFFASLWLASHYSSGGSLARAEAALEKAAAQTKFPAIRARALYEKALLLFRSGKDDQAEKMIRELETQYPDDTCLSAAYFLRGDILMRQKAFADAEAAYEKAAKRHPGGVLEQAAWGAAGDCCFAMAAQEDRSALYDRALSYYRKISEAGPVCPEYRAMACYKTARCLQLAGREEEAFTEYRKLLYLVPAREALDHPAETLWIVKGMEALVSLAEKNPAGGYPEAAVAGLNWLSGSGVLDPAAARKRIRTIRKKKYRPIIQEIHKK